MFTEREKTINAPEGVNVIPTEIPKHIEAHEGVQVVSQQPSATAIIVDPAQNQSKQTDDSVVISLPSDQQTLQQQVKKGNIKDALTWMAVFWLRMVKKATYFGWRVEQK